MPVTQMDVAQRAKVSRSLVSKVLFGDPDVRVSEEKRSQIVRLAKDMGYRPNSAATNLRLGRAHAVVAISRFDANGHQSGVERGTIEILAVELAVIGLELKLRPYASNSDVTDAINELVSTSVCDAVALWLPDNEGEESAMALEQHGIPFVTVGHHDQKHPEWLQVDFDHYAMMRTSVTHILSLGRKRIAYLGYDTDQGYARRLLDGFKSAMSDLTETDVPSGLICRVDDNSKVSERIADRWLDLPLDQQPTGLVIGAGNAAWVGVERALAKRGRRIGMGDGELVVTGQRFENAPLVYGDAMVFDNVQMSRVAYHMADLLRQKLAPGGSVVNPVVRIVPDLIPATSMEMPLPPKR